MVVVTENQLIVAECLADEFQKCRIGRFAIVDVVPTILARRWQ